MEQQEGRASLEPDGLVFRTARSPSPRRPLSALDNTAFLSPTRKLQRVQALELQDAVDKEGDVEGEAAEAARATGEEANDGVPALLEENPDFFGDVDENGQVDVRGTFLLRNMAEAAPSKNPEPATLLEVDPDFLDFDDRPAAPKKAKQAAVAVEDDMEEDEDFLAPTPSLPKATGLNGASTAFSSELEPNEDFFDLVTSNGPERASGSSARIPPTAHLASDSQAESQDLPSISQILPNRPVAIPSAQWPTRTTTLGSGPSRWITAAPMAATTFDGQVVRFKKRRRVGGDGPPPVTAKDYEGFVGSSVPIHRLMTEVNQRMEEVKRQKEREREQTFAPEAKKSKRAAVDSTLWTDRYRPTKFVDLMGDERVFRTAMSWLKEWDNCVFKTAASAASRKRAAKKRSQALAFGSSSSAAADAGSRFGGNGFADAVDPLGRPQEKVLLLCGPPGLGKTTMAHVLAAQAGYDVLEINASDDRTVKVVTDRIRGALETRTLDAGAKKGGGMSLGDNRPTCVVIDEIDGAGGGSEGGFVRALAKLVTDGSIVRKSKGKGKKGEVKPLVRPIICICNDLYATALRPLRPLAKVVRFFPPTNAMLVKRLRSICDGEGLVADLKNLTLLIETSAGDVRNCLNSLQFIKRQGNRVDEAAVRSAGIGSKDTGTSAQAALSGLFRMPYKQKKNFEHADGRYVHRLHRDLSTCGEYDRIVHGCFETYPSVRQQAATWQAYEHAHEWLDFYDRLDKKIRTDQSYEMLGYVPYSIVPFYELFANVTNKAPEYPRIDYEMYLKRTAHQEIADAFKQGLPVLVRDSFTSQNVICELMPLTMRIVSPDMKPVNSQLIRHDERAVLEGLVKLMLAMNLRFVQDKTEEGQLVFKLEPPIDVFVHYEGKRATDIPASRFAVRNMVAKEIEAELIKRAEGSSAEGLAGVDSILSAYKAKPAEPVLTAPQAVAVDFFGRKIAVQATNATRVGGPGPVMKAPAIVFKYHEGFSNAVKKPIKLHELLSR